MPTFRRDLDFLGRVSPRIRGASTQYGDVSLVALCPCSSIDVLQERHRRVRPKEASMLILAPLNQEHTRLYRGQACHMR
jgi:hypothetical protein